MPSSFFPTKLQISTFLHLSSQPACHWGQQRTHSVRFCRALKYRNVLIMKQLFQFSQYKFHWRLIAKQFQATHINHLQGLIPDGVHLQAELLRQLTATLKKKFTLSHYLQSYQILKFQKDFLNTIIKQLFHSISLLLQCYFLKEEKFDNTISEGTHLSVNVHPESLHMGRRSINLTLKRIQRHLGLFQEGN